MSKAMKIVIISAIVVLVGVGGFVLLNNKDSQQEANTGTNEQSQSMNTKKNSSNFAVVKEEKLDGKLVSSFPEDMVPLYPGTIVSSKAGMNSSEDRGEWNVAVSTTDSYAAVDAAIRSAFEEDNWSVASESKTLLGGTMLIVRSNKHTATITYDDNGEEGVHINYGVSQR